MRAQLPNYEIQFRRYSTNMKGGISTIIAGTITFGVMQRIVNVFNRVESSLQFLVHSWSTIVELISIYKRLKSFEDVIRASDGGRPVSA